MQIDIQNPTLFTDEVKKFRLTFEGGKSFKDEYLQTFSSRETAADFTIRGSISYVPAFAKSALYDITNSIYSRLPDVARLNGDDQYKSVMRGDKKGVDNNGSSMNGFIGGKVLPEMCAMKYVGVFVDMEAGNAVTRADDDRHPYCYIYKRESICSYAEDDNHELVALKVKASVNTIDPDTGLITGQETEHRFYRVIVKDGVKKVSVHVRNESDVEIRSTVLDIPMIPMVIFEIEKSLLTDVADYQIALLNMASANVSYDVKSNFPFYIEQADPNAGQHMRTAGADGTAVEAATGATKEIVTGAAAGRSYAAGMDAPAFINPSAAPLEVSMKKQDEMKREIRQLVNLNVSSMSAERESASSKKIDQGGLEAGLASLGTCLERGERKLAAIWQAYMSSETEIEIKYPEEYSSKTFAQRLKESQDIVDLIKHNPSITYQREMTKQSANLVLQNRVAEDVLKAIGSEIDSAEVIYVDPEVIQKDVEAKLVTTDYASGLRGYPEGEAKKAEAQQVRRAAMVVAAQTKEGQMIDGGARGVPDLDASGTSAKDEKDQSQDRSDVDIDNKSKTRGSA